jgi:SpoVK/Ycf46/Vps4 family AAA+-type ATPase
VVAQAAGLELFEVEYADRDGNSLSGRDRYRSLQIAQVFLKGSAQAALLFDEVEDVFPPISSEAAQLLARSEQMPGRARQRLVSGKAWVNQILESNTVPTLWVTNRIEQIDPAFRRRFAYHLEFKSPPPGAREGLVRKTLEGVAVTDAFVAKLTARKGLTPAQIRTAVRFAGLAQAGEAMHDGEALIERQLRNADQALGNKTQGAKGERRSVTTYDLAMLNVESRFEIPRIVAGAAKRAGMARCAFTARPAPARPRWPSTWPARWTARSSSSRPAT